LYLREERRNVKQYSKPHARKVSLVWADDNEAQISTWSSSIDMSSLGLTMAPLSLTPLCEQTAVNQLLPNSNYPPIAGQAETGAKPL
jgi:hypothetical protein